MKWLLLLAMMTIIACSHTVDKKNSATPAPVETDEEELALDDSSEDAVDPSIKKNSTTQIVGTANLDAEGTHKGKTYYLYGVDELKLDNYYFDIPVVYNEQVKKWIHYFLNRGRDYFERYSARAGRYAPIMGAILEENGMPRDLIFLAMAESGFNSKAKSYARAVGPWQFMPATGKIYDLKIDWYMDERQDPLKSTFAASRYLKKLYGDFGTWELAAAAYNAGEGKVGRAIKKYNTENFWNLSNRSYLKSETKNYVPKIMALAIIGKNLKAFGFEDIDFHEPMDFEEIDLVPLSDLFKVSEALEVEFEEIERLNPELLRWFTPPNVSTYKLRIPVGYGSKWEDCCASRPLDFKATLFQTHVVTRKKGQSLSEITKMYRVPEKVIFAFNPKLTNQGKLPLDTVIVLPFREGQTRTEDMYADLYEKPRKTILMKKKRLRLIELAKRRAKHGKKAKVRYSVKRGDTLYRISKKMGVSLDRLILLNYSLVKSRKVREGDVLIVK